MPRQSKRCSPPWKNFPAGPRLTASWRRPMHSAESSKRLAKLSTGFVQSRRLFPRRLTALGFRLSEIGSSSRCTATVFSRRRRNRHRAVAPRCGELSCAHRVERTLIQQDRAKAAADELLAAAVLGENWAGGLLQLADAAEAGGATLMRLRRDRPLAALSSTGRVDADTDTAMLAGHAPPSPRRFFPDHVFARGLLGDTNVWTDNELRRDAYFQEFLCPR